MAEAQSRSRQQEAQGRERWLMFMGDCPIVSDHVKKHRKKMVWRVTGFLQALFRGYGHAVFANNPFSGLLIMVALMWANFSVGLKGLFTSFIALTVSILLRYPQDEIDSGVTVMNPLLLGQVCGVALPGRFGIEFELQHWIYLALGSILTVYVTSAVSSLLGSIGKYPIPCLALPFNIVQFMLFAAVLHINSIQSPAVVGNISVAVHDSVTFSTPITDLDNMGYEQISGHGINSKLVDSTTLTSTTTSFSPSLNISSNVQTTLSHENMTVHFLEVNTTQSMETTALLGGNVTVTNASDTIKNQTGKHINIGDVFLQIFQSSRKKRESGKESSNNGAQEIVRDYLDWGQVFAGIVLSMTQVFGACHVPGALLIYLAVLLYSPITAVFALLGAILGTITGIGFSTAPYALVYEGVWGFNGLLIAEALSFFFIVTWQSLITTTVSVFFGVVLQNLLMISLEPANLPVMSVPFNLTVILFMCLGPNAHGKGHIRPTSLSFPEKHRTLYRHQLQHADKIKSSKPLLIDELETGKDKKAPLAEQEVV